MDKPRQPVCDPKHLVSLVKSGDSRALDEVTRCFSARMLAVGRSYCRNMDDADDAVQDALLSAGENLEQFRGEGSLEGWLVRMVVNACHKMRRGQKNNPAQHITEVDLLANTNPENAALQGQLIAKLGNAMLTLKPQDRAMLLLTEAEEWTAPEIAMAIGISAVAVRSRLMRARKKLRKVLEL